MSNLITSVITVLTIPLVFLNFGSGILGAGWLFFIYGEWHTPLYAFVVSLVAPFALTFPLMISMIFMIPGAFLYEKGFLGKVIGLIFLILGSLVTWSIIAIWGILVFDYAEILYSKNAYDIIPYLLLAYSVATSPWSYMASKESPDNIGAIIPNIFNQIAAAIIIYVIGIQKADILIIGPIYVGIMFLGFILSLVFGLISLNPPKKQPEDDIVK